MKPLHLTVGAAAVVGLLALGAWGPALAQKSKITAKTPFSYDIQNGRRVPKAKRVQAADGSWKEEVRSGNCSTVREQGPSGEYREARKCD